MTDGEPNTFKGRRYPADVEPLEDHAYRYTIGDNTIEDLGWQGHMKIAHEAGMTSRRIDVVDSGVDADGIRYSVVVATVVMPDGEFQAIQAADETTNQVRDPEYVHAVASSRAFKRAVKMALNIYPLEPETDQERQRVEQSGPRPSRDDPSPSGGSVDVDGDTGEVDVTPPDDHPSQQEDDDFEF